MPDQPDITNEQLGAQAVEIANAIEAVCTGRCSGAVYLAIAMVLGRSVGCHGHHLDQLMDKIRRAAAAEVMRAMQGKGPG